MRNIIDLTGQKFNRLTAISYDEHNNKWWWLCECGNKKLIDSSEVKRGKTKSCGCLAKELKPALIYGMSGMKIHGMSGTRFYNIFVAMKQRCDNEKSSEYNNYGGRGITVCDRWKSFENFKEDMYESYIKHVEEFGEKNTTLDRVGVDGNYHKDNCRWATYKEQMNNKSNNHIVEVDGKSMTVMEASKVTGIKYRTILSRLNKWGDIYGNRKGV